MNKFIKIIKNILPKESTIVLGRWNIEYCNKKLNRKIDLANEDHCGPCGEYVISKKIIEPVSISPNKEKE